MGAFGDVKVDDFMTSPVWTLRADLSLREAARTLLEQGFSGAPVVDEMEEVVGVLTLQDIARYAEWHLDAEEACSEAGGEREILRELDVKERGLRSTMHLDRLEEATVRQVMTSRVATVRTGASMVEAMSILLAGSIHRLFVTNSPGKLIGIITTMDFLRFFHESLK